MRSLFLISFLSLFINQLSYANETMLLRLHGSNTIGVKLGPELVKSWLLSEGYKDIKSHQLKDEERVISAINKFGDKKLVQIYSHGSSSAFTALKKGAADIGMSSRPIKGLEKNMLGNFGDMTRAATEYVIGLDGVAVIVSKKNSIQQLTQKTIKKIFTGEITHWKQINKKYKGKIQVYARNNKSGTYDTFKSLVLGSHLPLIKSAKRYVSNDKLSNDVAKDLLGIGFIGLPYINDSKALAIVEKGIAPKPPQSFDVATEDYALSRRLYMYAPNMESNRNIQSFIEYSLSIIGQDVVEKSGFISQNPHSQTVELHPDFPKEYLDFTHKSERLSMNFRFQKGTTSLDNKAMRDIKRLVDYIAKPENKSKKVMLFGFSESSEAMPVFALDLSIYRVDWVSTLLSKNGIDSIRVRGYGDVIPVASNENSGGRHKNRRVEVWVQ